MDQTQYIALFLKIGLPAGLVSITAWIALYSRLAPWWANPLGRTIVIEAALIAVLFVPQILSLFFQLDRLDSYIAAWSDVGITGLVSPVMAWRCLVWIRLDRLGRLPRNGHDDGGPKDAR